MMRHPGPGTVWQCHDHLGPRGSVRGGDRVVSAWWKMTQWRLQQEGSHLGTQPPAAPEEHEVSGENRAPTLSSPTFWFPNGVSDWPVWMIQSREMRLPGTEKGREHIWIEVGIRHQQNNQHQPLLHFWLLKFSLDYQWECLGRLAMVMGTHKSMPILFLLWWNQFMLFLEICTYLFHLRKLLFAPTWSVLCPCTEWTAIFKSLNAHTKNMLEMLILSPCSSTSIEPETLGWGPSVCVNKPSGESDACSRLRSTGLAE